VHRIGFYLNSSSCTSLVKDAFKSQAHREQGVAAAFLVLRLLNKHSDVSGESRQKNLISHLRRRKSEDEIHIPQQLQTRAQMPRRQSGFISSSSRAVSSPSSSSSVAYSASTSSSSSRSGLAAAEHPNISVVTLPEVLPPAASDQDLSPSSMARVQEKKKQEEQQELSRSQRVRSLVLAQLMELHNTSHTSAKAVQQQRRRASIDGEEEDNDISIPHSASTPFSLHRRVTRSSYEALLDVAVQDRDDQLAMSVMDVLRSSRYQLSDVQLILAAELFAVKYNATAALMILHDYLNGSFTRLVPSSAGKSSEMTVRMFDAVMFACSKQPGAAKQLFDFMKQEHNLKPDVRSYEALLFSHFYANEPEQATRTLLAMNDDQLTPSSSCYAAVLRTYLKQGPAYLPQCISLLSAARSDGISFDAETEKTLKELFTKSAYACQ